MQPSLLCGEKQAFPNMILSKEKDTVSSPDLGPSYTKLPGNLCIKLVGSTAEPCMCQVSDCRRGVPTDLVQNCHSLLLTETQWFLSWGKSLLKDSN